MLTHCRTVMHAQQQRCCSLLPGAAVGPKHGILVVSTEDVRCCCLQQHQAVGL
jgi:hypothetical protein